VQRRTSVRDGVGAGCSLTSHCCRQGLQGLQACSLRSLPASFGKALLQNASVRWLTDFETDSDGRVISPSIHYASIVKAGGKYRSCVFRSDSKEVSLSTE